MIGEPKRVSQAGGLGHYHGPGTSLNTNRKPGAGKPGSGTKKGK